MAQETKKPEVVASGSQYTESATDSASARTQTQLSMSLAESVNLYNTGAAMTENSPLNNETQSERFIKFKPSKTSDWLLLKYPKAFILLLVIAQRARRYNGHIDGFEIGWALLGDYENIGLSHREYRTALQVLTTYKFVEIIYFGKKDKKSTIKTTIKRAIKGTLVKLIDSSIWDINPEYDKHQNDNQNDNQATIKRQSNDNEQERKRKNKKEERDIEDSLRSSSCSDSNEPRKKVTIEFSFEQKCFLNITSKDVQLWKEAFQHINFDVALAEATNWVLDNPSKAKKAWRRFLTNWFKTAEKNAYFAKAKNAQLSQAPEVGKEWETQNRRQFFTWKEKNFPHLQHMEYEKGTIFNKRNGKKMHCKMTPQEFERTFASLSGIG